MLKRLSNAQVIACGFFLLIMIGSLLLSLPIATNSGQPASLGEAVFTATSATCVTGLIVQDTAVFWSPFGQAVILLLIQVGGMGFMTIATVMLMLFRQHIGIRNRERMIESISTADNGSILSLTKSIFFGTLCIEFLGAALLAIRFIPEFGIGQGIWFSVFHAISAFCNAGFDLMGTSHGAYTSLIAYADDPLVTLVICALITLGGLGYWVWQDLRHKHFHWRRYRLHTKLVLTVSTVLTVGGTVLFWLLERQNLTDVSPVGQFLRSLFNAVTPRTAGFSTTDAASLTDGSKLLTVIYMFIGGSAGSTAGGIKTTTIAVIIMCTFTEITHRRDTAAFGRRLEANALQRAAAIAANNAALALASALLICVLHPSLAVMDILLETFSAIATVGLSTGITRTLGDISHIALIFLMYCGRVGSLSFSLALLERRSRPLVTHPSEHIIIG